MIFNAKNCYFERPIVTINQGFLRCFRGPIRVPRIENRIPRIRDIGSLQRQTGYL